MIHLKVPDGFSPKIEVVSCFLEHNGDILLLHTQDHKREGNKWGVPAGKMEKDEAREDALLREIREETGLNLSPEEVKFITTVYVRYPDLDFIYHMYQRKFEERPEITIDSREHKGFQWITPLNALTLPLIQDEDPCIRLVYKL